MHKIKKTDWRHENKVQQTAQRDLYENGAKKYMKTDI